MATGGSGEHNAISGDQELADNELQLFFQDQIDRYKQSVGSEREESQQSSAWPNDGSDERIVVLRIPHFRQKDTSLADHNRRDMRVTLMSIAEHQARPGSSASGWSYAEDVTIPDEVFSCGPCLIGCTAIASKGWDANELLSKLFEQGYGGAILSICYPRDIGFGPPIIIRDVLQILESSVLPSSTQTEYGRPVLNEKLSLPAPVATSTSQTLYLVQFPDYSTRTVEGTDADLIKIHFKRPMTTMATSYIVFPYEDKDVSQSTVVLQHPNPSLDLEQLVEDMLILGFGRYPPKEFHWSLHRRLSNGGNILSYTVGWMNPNVLEHLEGHNDQRNHQPISYPSEPFKDQGQISRYPSSTQSSMSIFSSLASVMTASSSATFFSAWSSYNSPAHFSSSGYSPATRIETIREDEPPVSELSTPFQQLHKDYFNTLHQQNMILPFHKELNWSGKGQHVTFAPKDAVPLTFLAHVGSSMSATVDKVLCRRIAVARKTMRCNRKAWTVEDALREVYHLQNLRHFHIVQLVGTYLQGRNFSILMYPVADSHLGTFLEDTSDMRDSYVSQRRRRWFLASSLSCLTSAVAFIHGRTTKHMDIKPQNILIREIGSSPFDPGWRVYLADFGLSRSFTSQDHSQTDGPTSRTPRYCAPEVYKSERRGRSADIFSLGCVFLEILTVYRRKDLQDFADVRRGDSADDSFHANLQNVRSWIKEHLRMSSSDFDCSDFDYAIPSIVIEAVTQMICQQPGQRPTAAEIQRLFEMVNHFGCFGIPAFKNCCSQPPEVYTTYASPTSKA